MSIRLLTVALLASSVAFATQSYAQMTLNSDRMGGGGGGKGAAGVTDRMGGGGGKGAAQRSMHPKPPVRGQRMGGGGGGKGAGQLNPQPEPPGRR
jgi:hypothetical protein